MTQNHFSIIFLGFLCLCIKLVSHTPFKPHTFLPLSSTKAKAASEEEEAVDKGEGEEEQSWDLRGKIPPWDGSEVSHLRLRGSWDCDSGGVHWIQRQFQFYCLSVPSETPRHQQQVHLQLRRPHLHLPSR